jgi:hypothetical protein
MHLPGHELVVDDLVVQLELVHHPVPGHELVYLRRGMGKQMHVAAPSYTIQKIRSVATTNCTIRREVICAVDNRSTTESYTIAVVVTLDMALHLLVPHVTTPLSYLDRNFRVSSPFK